ERLAGDSIQTRPSAWLHTEERGNPDWTELGFFFSWQLLAKILLIPIQTRDSSHTLLWALSDDP
ncbi:MAG TPA: hypothetical protein VLJ79_32125, partial [Candidatus Binatia bacterium]|nr:hypothetical protein [Candidatus Binatia bacterium]